MIAPTDFILVAVMLMYQPVTKQYEIYYEPLDYFKTIGECSREQSRLARKGVNSVRYLCLSVDKD